MPSEDPRISEATEEQLHARLIELQEMGTSSYDKMMSLLLEANQQAEKAEFEGIKQLQKDLESLSKKARYAAALDSPCTVCGKKAGEECFEGDLHAKRTFNLDHALIEKKARELRPDLFQKAERYKRMIEERQRA